MSWGETLFLKKIIEGKRTLAASDNVLKVLFSGDKFVEDTDTFVGTFIPKKDGSVRVLVAVSYNNDYTASSFVTINIKEKGVVVASKGVAISTDSNYQYFSIDVAITTNSSYDVYIKRTNGGVSLKEAKICASIVDTSLVEVV